MLAVLVVGRLGSWRAAAVTAAAATLGLRYAVVQPTGTLLPPDSLQSWIGLLVFVLVAAGAIALERRYSEAWGRLRRANVRGEALWRLAATLNRETDPAGIAARVLSGSSARRASRSTGWRSGCPTRPRRRFGVSSRRSPPGRRPSPTRLRPASR
jgi:K+-sensing histidine kinase KdpD